MSQLCASTLSDGQLRSAKLRPTVVQARSKDPSALTLCRWLDTMEGLLACFTCLGCRRGQDVENVSPPISSRAQSLHSTSRKFHSALTVPLICSGSANPFSHHPQQSVPLPIASARSQPSMPLTPLPSYPRPPRPQSLSVHQAEQGEPRASQVHLASFLRVRRLPIRL